VSVILFKKPEYGVYFFFNNGVHIVRKWFDDKDIGIVGWAALEARLNIYESCGFRSIRSCAIDLGDGFFGLQIGLRGVILPCPIFRLGPFDEEMEITFLAGASWDEKKKRVRPFGAVGEAEENLELLLEDRNRRRRG